MNNIIYKMKSFCDFIGRNGCSEEDILNAEMKLGLSFANDYRSYLSAIGVACFNGHEFTGLTSIKRINVVLVTLEQRHLNSNIPSDWYVVEEANVDGIVIWQNKVGEIFSSIPNGPTKKIADNLIEYIDA